MIKTYLTHQKQEAVESLGGSQMIFVLAVINPCKSVWSVKAVFETSY